MSLRGRQGAVRVLVVEDDATMHPLCRAVLRNVLGTGEVDEARTAEEAFQLMRERRYDLVLADYYLPSEKTGLDVLEAARDQAPDTLRVLITGRPDARMAHAALNRVGVHGFLHKPGDAGLLTARLTRLLARY